MPVFTIALRRLFLGLTLCIVGALDATSTRATILGLGDGTYDVTLTCVFSDCAPAGPLGPFMGTLTVSGNDVTDWSFTFPTAAYGFADVFSGNPQETILMFGDEIVSGSAASSAELQIATFGSPRWNVNFGGAQVIHGPWTAVLQDPRQRVSEPASAIPILSGLAALAAVARRRSCAVTASSGHHRAIS
jgi:hypothetical protein